MRTVKIPIKYTTIATRKNRKVYPPDILASLTIDLCFLDVSPHFLLVLSLFTHSKIAMKTQKFCILKTLILQPKKKKNLPTNLSEGLELFLYLIAISNRDFFAVCELKCDGFISVDRGSFHHQYPNFVRPLFKKIVSLFHSLKICSHLCRLTRLILFVTY